MSATEQKPPRNWTTTLLFLLTFLAALVLVPWYGLRHGFSAGAWSFFAFFLIAYASYVR